MRKLPFDFTEATVENDAISTRDTVIIFVMATATTFLVVLGAMVKIGAF